MRPVGWSGCRRWQGVTIEVAGHEVRLSNPGKVYFPKRGITKLDLVEYYLAAADAALVHLRERPDGDEALRQGDRGGADLAEARAAEDPRLAADRDGVVPVGRTAEELCASDAAHLVWAINLGVIDFNPWPARRDDLDHPDELRVDLDPTPGVGVGRRAPGRAGGRATCSTSTSCAATRRLAAREGIHVNVRIEPEWDFTEVRRAALALAREVERRTPLATSKWWKEERHGVFVDYNQNARDRTVASAYSVRPTPDARVSCPLDWDEVADVETARAAPGHRARRAWRRSATRPPTSTRTRAGSTRCTRSPTATRARASATRRGRRTSPSSAASPSACSRAATATGPSPRSAAAPAIRSRAGRPTRSTGARQSRASAARRARARARGGVRRRA